VLMIAWLRFGKDSGSILHFHDYAGRPAVRIRIVLLSAIAAPHSTAIRLILPAR